MPIIIPDNLPAVEVLQSKHICYEGKTGCTRISGL